MAEEPGPILIEGQPASLLRTDEHGRICYLPAVGPGGAYHHYLILPRGQNPAARCLIRFQEGGVAEAGFNGIHNEDLLRVVIDRLQCFQRGPFACGHNALALVKLEEALAALEERTAERQKRGVEGHSVV